MRKTRPLLTGHQWRILDLLSKGLTNKELARNLGVSENTIEKYLSSDPDDSRAIFRRLSVTNRTEAALWYCRERAKGALADFSSVRGNRLDDLECEEMLRWTESLVNEIGDAIRAEAPPEASDYLGRVHYAQLYNSIVARFWDELQPVILALFQRKRNYLRDDLLVAFVELLAPYLNGRGYHRERLSLAMSAAQAARKLGQKTNEGWLRCDAISWTLIEYYQDPIDARVHLARARELADELRNTDMGALATAFQARTYLLEADIGSATRFIDQALNMSCSAVFEARIHLAAGDIAFSRHKFEQAIQCYDRANSANLSFGASLRKGHSYLAIREITQAKEQFISLLPKVRAIWQSPHKLALAKFGLALVAKIEGDTWMAQHLASESNVLLQPLELLPLMRQQVREVQYFRASVKG